MAQATSNLVQSTNPFAGLLGLTPKPLAQSSFSGLMKTSTPAVLNPKPLNMSVQAPVAAPVAQPAPVQQAPVQQSTPVASTTPVLGGANSGGTLNPNYNLQTQGGAAPVTTPSRGLFPNVVSSLAGLNTNYQDLAKKAGDIGEAYGKQYADVGTQGARAKAGYLTTGTTPVAEGNAAVVAQTTAAQQSAIAAGEQAALQGVQTGINANTGASSALSSAGNLSQPSPAAFGQTVFDPTTGQYNDGGGLPAEVMQQYAQMAATGQYASIPASITSNPVLNAQLNVAAKALNPKYTPVGAAGASNVLQSIPALTSANTAAEGIKNQIQSYIQSNPQLNPSDLAAGNLLNQWIQGKQLTDPKYQTLFNYLNEYTNTLAPILGVGGDPTNLKTQIAQGFINAAASGQSISQVLNAMSTLATNKIGDLQSGAIGGSTSIPSPQAGGAGNIKLQASDGNQYGFYQDANGVWHSQ